jgi:hypothetical protein
MSEEGSEPDIKPRRFNVAEVPKAEITPAIVPQPRKSAQ